jgi:hypothetical protein
MSIASSYPDKLPTVGYNFAKTRRLSPGVQFSRASVGTYVGSDGLIKTARAGEPRFDYNPLTGNVKGLLIQPTSSNFTRNSQSLNSWQSVNGMLVESGFPAPDGSNTAFKLTQTIAGNNSYILSTNTGFTGGSMSVFFKKGNVRYANYRNDYGIDLDTGTFAIAAGGFFLPPSGSYIEKYPNGWYRICCVNVSSGFVPFPQWRFRPAGEFVYVWGAQTENVAFPTSYIPTTTSAVTRAADTLTIPLKDQDFSAAQFLFNQNNPPNSTTPLATFSSSASSPSYSLQLSNPNGVPTLRQVVGSFTPATISLPRPATLQTAANVAINFDKTTGQTELVSSITDNEVAAVKQLPSTASIPFTSSYFDTLTIGPCEGLKGFYLWEDNLSTNQLASLAEEQGGFNKPVVTTSGFQDELYDKITTSFNKPTLDLDFATTKTLNNKITGTNLITFTRASTGTYVDSDGLIKSAAVNEARFDHNPTTGESLGLLVEEARTNLIINSEEFASPVSSWTRSSVSVISNTTIAPDGTLTADTVSNIPSQFSWIRPSLSLNSSLTYTLTLYVKPLTTNKIISFEWPGPNTFDLSNPGAGVQTLPNDWYRLTVVKTGVTAGPTIYIGAYGITSDNVSFAFWGAQCEQASFSTSYIPTNGSAVTRSADVASISGTNFSSWYNTTEGTWFGLVPTLSGSAGRLVEVMGPTNLDYSMSIRPRASSSRIDFARQASSAPSVSVTYPCKMAASYSSESIQGAANGTLASLLTSGNHSNSTNMAIGRIPSENTYLGGTISRIAYWPIRLSNTNLQNLTKLDRFEMVMDSSLPSNGVCAIITSGTVTYTVDWGDETAIETVVATGTFTKTHAYSVPKTHVVKIAVTSGTFRPFYNNSGFATHIKQLRATPSGWSFGITLNGAWYNGTNTTFVDSGLSTSAVTDFSSAWRACSSLTRFPLINTTAGTSFSGTWLGCSSLTSFPLINTAAGTNFTNAWNGCNSLTSFPLINTAAGTSFIQTWYGCSSLTSFPLINTAAGTNFSSAWRNCSSLTSFPLINTAGGTNFSFAWQICSSLTSFPLINTAAGTSFSFAWNGCSSLASFPLLNTAAGTNFTGAWASCNSLTSFPALDFDAAVGIATTSSVGFENAWVSCTQLADFPPNLFNTTVATRFLGAFQNCALTATSIENIIVSINTANTSNGTLTLSGGTNATKSTWTTAANTAYDALIARGWTITFRA